MSVVLVSAALFTATLAVALGADPLVNTTIGLVRGSTAIFQGVSVDVYRGIRYAEAPVGQLRFSPPRPYANPQSSYNATEFGPWCPQDMSEISRESVPNTLIDEDCLMLNIYVPETAAPSNKLAVIVWIHGGLLLHGQSGAYDGTPLAVIGQVIVVTINYRLGALGFLSTGDGFVTGNNGLRDQQLALHWIRDNIGRFNGDPNRVTLSGESTGGLSILYHLFSPASTGLFHRAIVQSAVFWEPTEPRRASDNARALAALVNCSSSPTDAPPDNERMLGCLRTVSVDALIEAQGQVQPSDVFSPPFIMTLDRDVVPSTLRSMMEHGNLQKYNAIIGTEDVSTSLLPLIAAQSHNLNMSAGLSSNNFETIVQLVADSYATSQHTVANALRYQYTNWQNVDDAATRLAEAAKMISDRQLTVPALTLAHRCANQDDGNKSTYLYNFAASPHDQLTWTGGRGDEYANLWQQVNTSSRSMFAYWSNFAKTGDPNNGNSSEGLIYWPKFTTESQQYLRIHNDDLSTRSKPGVDTVAFWTTFIPSISAPENECPDAMAPPFLTRGDPVVMETVPRVETTYGDVAGFTVQSHQATGGRSVDVFLGIPYAEPPLGSMRFRSPESPEPWTGQLNATRHKPACLQHDRPISSEDCLYLNVYTPQGQQRSSDDWLPVMVIVEGSDLVMGDASHLSGDALAAFGDVVVVTFNYRLGVLGFLSTENDTLPGNYGLRDILHVLEWVRGDIGNFGGNPDKVTLAGFSSGAWAVQYLMTSRLSKDLFRRVVCLSGSSLSPMTDMRYRKNSARHGAERFIRQVHCEGSDNNRLVRCLRELSDDRIRDVAMSSHHAFTPMVVVDGDVLSHDPYEMMLTGGYEPMDMILGATNSEMAKTVLRHEVGSRQDFIDAIDNILESYLFGNADLVAAAIERDYLTAADENDARELTKRLLDMTDDFMMHAPTVATANMHTSAGGSVYLYHYTQRPSYSTFPEWVGASRGDDVKLLLGEPFHMSNHQTMTSFNDQERRLSQVMMKYISNFIKAGNPNVGHADVSMEWPEFTFDEQMYLEVDICPDVRSKLRHQGASFWNHYVPLLEEVATDSDESSESPLFGEGFGLEMTEQQMETLVQALVGVIIALLVLFMVVVGALCGYAHSLAGKKTKHHRQDTHPLTNGVNNGFVMNLNEDDYFTRL